MKEVKVKKNNQIKIDFGKVFAFYFLIFIIGSIVGWLYEEIFYFVNERAITNRGFLYGPYLPVYGFGAILLVLFLKRFRKNPIIVFLLAIIITGVLEYFTGLIMWEIWHQKWWDYTGLFLNIDGYVCLRSVLTFGIGSLLLIYLVEPLVIKMIDKIKKKTLMILCFSILTIFIIDNIITFIFRHPI